LKDDTGGIRGLGKIEKVYLDNTNLIYALAENEVNVGNLHETFFLNQTRVKTMLFHLLLRIFRLTGGHLRLAENPKVRNRLRVQRRGMLSKIRSNSLPAIYSRYGGWD